MFTHLNRKGTTKGSRCNIVKGACVLYEMTQKISDLAGKEVVHRRQKRFTTS